MQSKKSNFKQRHSFEAIGTSWTIEADEIDIEKIKARIAEYDKNYSRFREDSLVWKMRTPGEYTLPDDAKDLFDLYQKLYLLTDGKMTPFIGTVMEQAGYDKDYSLVEKKLEVPPLWNDAVEYNFPKLIIKQPILIDIGAMGKGHLVDIVGNMISGNYVIDAGGDIKVKGITHVIGLENPDDTNQVIKTLEIKDKSIAGSSGNRRKWGRFNHIIDPFKLESPSEINATWAVADSAMLADALATALYFTDPEELKKHFNFEYYIIRT